MPLAATIPASCLQYHNPSWSLSLSESPSVFIFPLERELSSRLGPRGAVTLLVMDGSSWPPVPQLPPSTSIFTSAQACPQRSKVTSERARLGSGPYARSMQFTEHSQTLRPSRRQVNTSPALTEPLPEHLGALFPADFPSVKRARQGGGVPRPPRGRPTFQAPSLPRPPRAEQSRGLPRGQMWWGWEFLNTQKFQDKI